MHQKLVPDLFFFSVNKPSSHCMQEILLKIRYFEKGLSKIFKKSKLYFFSFQTSPFWWTNLSKTKWAWNYWTFPLQVIKQVQKKLFISHISSDQVWWCNIKRFLYYSKNYICKLMEANAWQGKLMDDIINYFTSICPFESGKSGKEEQKI